MLKKIISMATATLLLAGGLSVAVVPSASATAVSIECAGMTSSTVVYVPMTSGAVTLNMGGTCSGLVPITAPTPSGLTLTAGTNSTAAGANVNRTTPGTAWVVDVAGTGVSQGDTDTAIATIIAPGSVYAKAVFVTPAFFTDATLSSLSLTGASISSFSSSNDSYTVTTTSSGTQTVSFSALATASKIGVNKSKSAAVTASCGGSNLTLTQSLVSTGYTSADCALSAGETKVIAITVTALDGSTTKTYEIAVTRSQSGGGSQSCSSGTSRGTQSNLTDTSVDIDFAATASACSQVANWTVILKKSGVIISSTVVAGSTHAISYSSLVPGSTYSVAFADPAMIGPNNIPMGYEPSFIFTTTGTAPQSSTPTVDTAAIAAAAAKAAAAVAAAKTTIVETLKSGKPLTVTDLSAADIRVASEKAAARVNTKLLALPVEKRADIAAVAAIVRTENFVDKVSTATTQVQVTTRDLVVEKLLAVDYKYKASVLRAVLAKDPSALDSIEKVDAVVKAAIASVQARKDRIAAIIAKISGTPTK